MVANTKTGADALLDQVLGRSLVALHQTPWFSPCHRPQGSVVGADDFTCRPLLEVKGAGLFELAAGGLWPFDAETPHQPLVASEHRFENLRPLTPATLQAVVLGRAVEGSVTTPLVVLDNGVALGLEGPPGQRLWVRDLEDLLTPQAEDSATLPLRWTDAESGQPVDLRLWLPLRSTTTAGTRTVRTSRS